MRRPLLQILALNAALGAALVATASAASSDKRRSSSPPAPATAAPTAAAPGNSFEAFQLIVERNIFNPNRVGRTRAAPEEKPPRFDEIALVGTMNYDKGLIAFFDSPDSAFRKTVRVGEKVGDFKVQSIGADHVELLQGEKTLTLKVAQQLRRPEGGEWTVRANPVAAPTVDSRGVALGTTGPSVPEPSSAELPADASEVLKRLMQKREKQLNK
jgi:hypothetical protein